MSEVTSPAQPVLSVTLLQKQRSHVLFLLSNSLPGSEADFLRWYQQTYRHSVQNFEGVLTARYYEQHEVDITQGQFDRPPFHYLGIYELSVDGAAAAAQLMDEINELHAAQKSAQPPAMWLYYPACEKVGRSPQLTPTGLIVAFANGLPGHEAEFREWYATCHIRHALKISALVSGQCFERTRFQKPGAAEPAFSTIAVYEFEGDTDSILESFAQVPEEQLPFPTLDLSRFAECMYRPI